jgi:putative ABC transport system ATP-binding protein
MIKAENITKIYKTGAGDFYALKDLSLHVPPKQFVAITGKSGSGKSTLLYQLSLLDTPDTGRIIFDGRDLSLLNSKGRTNYRLFNLGYVFQDYALIPTLSAIENVMVPLIMQGFSRHVARQKATVALDNVGLADKLDNTPSRLSGGQQQRVSIARAIAHQPQILFADEPTANLDSETSQLVLDTFVKLNSQGQTIIMVTHELEYARRTHRIVVLDDGTIKSDDLLR